MSWNSRYRKLRLDDIIDRAKGDQCQDTGNGYWILSVAGENTGRHPVHGEAWRRPIKLQPEDLDERTATFSR